MTEPIDLTARRIARRKAADAGRLALTNEQIAADIEAQRESLRKQVERGVALPPSKGWAETASWVDEGTWQRILDEHEGEARAELERIRPPAAPEKLPDPEAERQREALERLARANRTNPLVRRSKP